MSLISSFEDVDSNDSDEFDYIDFDRSSGDPNMWYLIEFEVIDNHIHAAIRKVDELEGIWHFWCIPIEQLILLALTRENTETYIYEDLGENIRITDKDNMETPFYFERTAMDILNELADVLRCVATGPTKACSRVTIRII